MSLVLEEVRELEARIASIDQQLAHIVREDSVARRLHQIPGVGVITATALVGTVATSTPFVAAVISRVGWGSLHASHRAAAVDISAGSANAVMSISAAC